jgi:two-component system sensor kinase FixL
MGLALRERRPVSGSEVVAERPDGTRVPFIAYPAPLENEAGEVTGGVNVLVDISQRKKTEAALRDSEARLRLALEAGQLAFWELNVVTGSITRGPGHDRIFGHEQPVPEWDYRAFLDQVLPEERARVESAYYAAIQHRTGAFIECRIRRLLDGEVRWIELQGQPQVEPGGRVVRHLGVVRDITDRKRTETILREKEARLRDLHSELLHVSRLSAAGEMASALAHELNQPLTAISSAVRAAQRTLLVAPQRKGSAGEIVEALDLAAEQAVRAGHIVRNLRDFVARDGEADKQIEDLSKLAEEAGALALVGAREHGVEVRSEFDPQLPPVLVDRIQIQQVLLNLMRNAVEAMRQDENDEAPSARKLTLSARRLGPDLVEVAVADTGPGLSPEIAARLFEPFVSNKPGGMGMGLSICRSIVEAHGGRLWAEPNAEGGTVFRFTLPAASTEAPSSA